MTDLDEDLPDLAAAGPGTYRLRVHARGRDQAVDLAPDTVTEHYLLQCWPQPPHRPNPCAPPTTTAAGYAPNRPTRPASPPTPRAGSTARNTTSSAAPWAGRHRPQAMR
ncbi:hypothetical protein LT493_24490 [Streptomyces tricolor]|nr:hypothetical protein [Streptomyces tricolor]